MYGNPRQDSAVIFNDTMGQFGVSRFFRRSLSLPWTVNAGALGIEASTLNKRSDALLQMSNKPREHFAGQVPIILAVKQYPRQRNLAGRNAPQLPLNFVNPMLAWRPG